MAKEIVGIVEFTLIMIPYALAINSDLLVSLAAAIVIVNKLNIFRIYV